MGAFHFSAFSFNFYPSKTEIILSYSCLNALIRKPLPSTTYDWSVCASYAAPKRLNMHDKWIQDELTSSQILLQRD